MAKTQGRWIDRTSAARILELSKPAAVDALVKDGLIFARKCPGTNQLYLREDCEKMARIINRPATSADRD